VDLNDVVVVEIDGVVVEIDDVAVEIGPRRRWFVKLKENEKRRGRWRSGGMREGKKNEKDERRESYQIGEVGIRVFFSLNINGRAGGYPPDKKHKTHGPPETQIRKIIKIRIRPLCTHRRAAG
jgi:hypothetical protein